MDGFPGPDLTVFRAILPKLDTVMLSSPNARRNRSSPSSSRNDAGAPSPSSSRPVTGTMIISPSHEFDHADALSLVKSARAAGLRLPENANYIFLPPSATPAEPAPSTTATQPTSEDPEGGPPSSGSLESSPLRLRERKRPPTSTKKFLTTGSSSTGSPTVTAKVSRKKRASPEEDSSANLTAQDSSRESTEFQIEKILKKRVTHGSRVRYLIKWVGSDELTWEPRSNFASDNDAWLAFKEEQAAKRTSATRTGKVPKSMSREKEFSEEDSVDMVTPQWSTFKKDVLSKSLSEPTTKKTETTKKSNSEVAVDSAGPSSGSVTKIDVPVVEVPKLLLFKTASKSDATEKLFDQLDQLLATPPVGSVVTKIPAISKGVVSQTSVSLAASPMRSIAPQPTTGHKYVQLTQVKHGDMYVYVPHNFGVSSASSTSVVEATTTSPAGSSSATPTVTIHLPPSLESGKPMSPTQIQIPKNTVLPGLSSPGLVPLNGVTYPQIGTTTPSTSRVTTPNGVQSTPSSSPRIFQVPTARSPPPLSALYNGLPGWPSSPTQSRVVRPMIRVSPATVLLGAPPVKIIPPRSPTVLIRPKSSREMGVNTGLSFVKVKDLTSHAGIGKSGLDEGALVVNISGFKPRDVAITCLDDIAFLVTYANRDSEFVDYQECIRKIPHEVAEFLFKNKINAVDSPPLRIVT